jgi:hypothetical protein
MTQHLGIQVFKFPMWCVIMIRHEKNVNWKIWIMVKFYINDLQVINKYVMTWNMMVNPTTQL